MEYGPPYSVWPFSLGKAVSHSCYILDCIKHALTYPQKLSKFYIIQYIFNY